VALTRRVAYVMGSRMHLMFAKQGRQQDVREPVVRRVTLGESKAQVQQRRSKEHAKAKAEQDARAPAGPAASSTPRPTREEIWGRPGVADWLRDHESLTPSDDVGESSAALLILWEVDHGMAYPADSSGGWGGGPAASRKR